MADPASHLRTVAIVTATTADVRPATTGTGILLCLGSIAVFGIQDAMTKFLVDGFPIGQYVMIRQWAFAVFMIAYAASQGQLITAARAKAPGLQVTRALLLLGDIACFGFGIRYLGLADMHAIFAVTPLMVTVLSGPLLGETVGWRRRVAVVVGFAGALLIIGPSFSFGNWGVLFALAATTCWSLYNILTRLVSRQDSFMTSTLYTAVLTALIATPFGLSVWEPGTPHRWMLMAGISMTGIAGHMLFIKALEFAPAIVLQPFTYLLLVWATLYGALLFGMLPGWTTVIGAAIVVASGLYVVWREWVRKKDAVSLPVTATASPDTNP